MTPVKMIALVFIVFALVKIAVICVNPLSWKAFVRKIYGKPAVTAIVSLIMAAVILRYLLRELTIVQVFASMTFMMALMMAQFAMLGNEIIGLSDRFLNDRTIIKKMWVPITIWIALMGWVLYELFV